MRACRPSRLPLPQQLQSQPPPRSGRRGRSGARARPPAIQPPARPERPPVPGDAAPGDAPSLQPPCRRWSNDGFKQYVIDLEASADEALRGATPEEREAAAAAVSKALTLELGFWNMAYEAAPAASKAQGPNLFGALAEMGKGVAAAIKVRGGLHGLVAGRVRFIPYGLRRYCRLPHARKRARGARRGPWARGSQGRAASLSREADRHLQTPPRHPHHKHPFATPPHPPTPGQGGPRYGHVPAGQPGRRAQARGAGRVSTHPNGARERPAGRVRASAQQGARAPRPRRATKRPAAGAALQPGRMRLGYRLAQQAGSGIRFEPFCDRLCSLPLCSGPGCPSWNEAKGSREGQTQHGWIFPVLVIQSRPRDVWLAASCGAVGVERRTRGVGALARTRAVGWTTLSVGWTALS